MSLACTARQHTSDARTAARRALCEPFGCRHNVSPSSRSAESSDRSTCKLRVRSAPGFAQCQKLSHGRAASTAFQARVHDPTGCEHSHARWRSESRWAHCKEARSRGRTRATDENCWPDASAQQRPRAKRVGHRARSQQVGAQRLPLQYKMYRTYSVQRGSKQQAAIDESRLTTHQRSRCLCAQQSCLLRHWQMLSPRCFTRPTSGRLSTRAPA